jgi:MFS family permease
MSNITADGSPSIPPIPATAWSPLRQPLFRALRLASVASNIGTWMQNVGAAWLMTCLAPTPTMVAMVQAATTLPVFLTGLPAGAIADLLDRRPLLLATQGWMLVAATLLGVLTFFDATTPWLLLSLTFTFALGLGPAMNAPARATLKPMPLSVTAALSSDSPTNSGVIACHAGEIFCRLFGTC